MKENTAVYAQLKDQIMHLKSCVENLAETGRDIPAIACNIVRIAASVKMLELNIVDGLIMTDHD